MLNPTQELTAEGDWVVLFSSHDEMLRVQLCAGAISQFRGGKYWNEDIIGKPFGSRVFDRKDPKKSSTVLPLTPELRTLSLDHRTQVLYAPDLGLAGMLLNLRSGSRIVESGTGSGSATVSFARAVGSSGKIFTFEYHQSRAQHARDEFRELGLDQLITCSCRNAYVDGFGPLPETHSHYGTEGWEGVSDGTADGVFLDLPQPWLAQSHADRILKNHCRMVVFIPCAEQLQEATAEFRRMKYQQVEAFEVVCKAWGVWTPADAARRLERAEQARTANKRANRTSRELRPIDTTLRAKFDVSPLTMYQLPQRGHTGYLLVGTKPPISAHA